MDAFSYLSVLLSIILGLGLTQLLTASSRLIRYRACVRIDWLPVLWATVMLVVYVQVWWAMFGLRQIRDWTFVSFLVVLTQTVTLYMMAALALPEDVDEAGVDLKTHYERQHRWFFGFFLATLIASIVKDVVLGGQLPQLLNLAFHILFATICISGIVITRRRYHETIGIVAAVAIAAYVWLLFTHLS